MNPQIELMLDTLQLAVRNGHDTIALFRTDGGNPSALVIHLPQLTPAVVERIRTIIEKTEQV